MCWEKSQDLRIGSLATAGRDLRSAFQVDFPFGGHPPSRLTCFAKIVLLLGFPNSITQHMKYRTMMEYYEICWVYHIIVSYNVVNHGFPWFPMVSRIISWQIRTNPISSFARFNCCQSLWLPLRLGKSEVGNHFGPLGLFNNGDTAISSYFDTKLTLQSIFGNCG